METFDTLDRTKVNTKVSEAVSDLESALMYIVYAKSEIISKFSGESFDAYVDELDSLYESIRNTKDTLNDLYR